MKCVKGRLSVHCKLAHMNWHTHVKNDTCVSPKMRTVPVRELGFVYPSLETGIYSSQFGNWDHRHNLSLQTGIDREMMNI